MLRNNIFANKNMTNYLKFRLPKCFWHIKKAATKVLSLPPFCSAVILFSLFSELLSIPHFPILLNVDNATG